MAYVGTDFSCRVGPPILNMDQFVCIMGSCAEGGYTVGPLLFSSGPCGVRSPLKAACKVLWWALSAMGPLSDLLSNQTSLDDRLLVLTWLVVQDCYNELICEQIKA